MVRKILKDDGTAEAVSKQKEEPVTPSLPPKPEQNNVNKSVGIPADSPGVSIKYDIKADYQSDAPSNILSEVKAMHSAADTKTNVNSPTDELGGETVNEEVKAPTTPKKAIKRGKTKATKKTTTRAKKVKSTSKKAVKKAPKKAKSKKVKTSKEANATPSERPAKRSGVHHDIVDAVAAMQAARNKEATICKMITLRLPIDIFNLLKSQNPKSFNRFLVDILESYGERLKKTNRKTK